MVGCEMYSEIQKRKTMGYSQRRCAKELNTDKKTVRKYWEMSEDDFAKSLIESQKRSRMLDPYRTFIVNKLEEYPEITSAIIDDNLRTEHAEFPASYRSVRRYVAELREELGIPTPVHIRQYTEVAEQPMGFQSQVDMGEKNIHFYGKSVKVFEPTVRY